MAGSGDDHHLPRGGGSGQAAGGHLGYSAWTTVDQDRANCFAEATGDHQWIHVDPARAARESPFGGPVAHGYLTLSMVPSLIPQIYVVEGVAMTVNYGCDRVRYPSPVPVGSELRMGAHLPSVEPVSESAYQVKVTFTFEVRGVTKPS
ncbi:MAG: MaoC family dehydratase [Acidimicrobiales bacterium]